MNPAFSDPFVLSSAPYCLVLLLYVGPEQAIPLLSFLAAIAGFVLMWWRKILTAVRGLFRAGKPDSMTAPPPAPPSTKDSVSE